MFTFRFSTPINSITLYGKHDLKIDVVAEGFPKLAEDGLLESQAFPLNLISNQLQTPICFIFQFVTLSNATTSAFAATRELI